MLGKRHFSTGSAAAFMALALAATACNPDAATTGPSGLRSKDFAANLRLVSGDQQSGPLAAALVLPIVVRVVDAGGQAVSGATVTFSVRAGGGSVNPAANVSGPDGLVSANWTMGTTLGENKVVALLTNQFVLDSAVFKATATVGAATRFVKISGDLQTGAAGRALGAPLVVKVQDNFGNNVSGAKVTWTPNAGSISFTADTTGADGTATASWRLGTVASLQGLSASIVGGASPLTFSATATPDTGRVLTVTAGAAQSANISTTLAVPLALRVTDQWFNPVSGEAITWNDLVVGGGTLSSNAAVTNAAGISTTIWTLGGRPGPQRVRAKLTMGTDPSDTAAFTATATVAFSDVRAGNFQTCAVTSVNNRAYCWGLNDVGQLGKGTTSNTNAPSTPVASGADTLNGPFPGFRQMTSGRSLFCGITPARALYCWGRLITGVTASVATLQTITSGGSQATANLISVGEEHMCHLSLPGQAFCTGVNESGQVGNGTTTSTGAGAWVAVSPAANLYSTITAGRSHTCAMPRYDALVPASRVPLCFGLNNAGQVGDGTTVNKSVGTAVVMPAGVAAFDSLSLTAGGAHTCATTVGGTAAYCWGNNGFGQLGIGAIDNATHPNATIVSNAGGLVWSAISAGEYHTCAISSAGDAYCWGRNDYGQLGNNSRTHSGTPVPVGGGVKFRSITVGELHTCAVAGTIGTPTGPSATPGVVYCWGDNVYGQVGNGSNAANTPVLTPTRVLYQP